MNAFYKLAVLRAAGWSVAVHNDYRIGDRSYTFWLFTHPSGRWVKGEGATDEAALDLCVQAARLGDPCKECGGKGWLGQVCPYCNGHSTQAGLAVPK